MEERLRTTYRGSRSISQATEESINQQYDELLKSIHSEAPPAEELFAFMFDSPDVPADVTQESEAILTDVMGESRTWAWVEVDLPMIRPEMSEQFVMGAIGIDADNPLKVSVVKLTEVHNKWEQTKRGKHPLIPILEFWHRAHGAAKK